jgi:Cu2+-containing amine oxidase
MIYESINLYKNNEIDEFDDNDEENGDEFKYENLNNIILETLTNSNTRKRFIKMENTLINNLKKIIQQKQSPSFNFTINKKKITLDNWNLIFIYNILKGIVFYIFYFFNILKGIILYF